MRRQADVNMRTRRDAGNRSAKCGEGNAVPLQETDQRLSLRIIRLQRDVHGVVMIQTPLVMNRALSEHGNR